MNLFYVYVWLLFIDDTIINYSTVMLCITAMKHFNFVAIQEWIQVAKHKSAVIHQWNDPQGFVYWLLILHPNEFLNKENETIPPTKETITK